MAETIALFNQKGGVGKTTTCVNLCACLAKAGRKVLAVDFDPQSNLSSGLNVEKQSAKKNIYNLINGDADAGDIVRPTSTQNLCVIPGSIDLAGAEVEISNVAQRETILKRALAQIKPEYDYIIIDCPPSLGLIPINALTAADSVMIPIQCEYYALEGVSQLINTVNLVKKSLNPNLRVKGVILTMYDARTNLSQQVTEEVRNYFGDKVYKTIIPRNVRLAEAPSYGMDIISYDPLSRGAKSYIELTKEILEQEKR